MTTCRSASRFASAWAVLALLAPLGAQDDATPAEPPADSPAAGPQPDALQDFAELVRRAHWADEREQAVDRFRAEILLQPAARDEDRVDVRLRVGFVMPRFLRYRIEESGEVIEQGLDQRGPWLRVGDRIQDLRRGEAARSYGQERTRLLQNVRVARQLVAFLDPAGTLQSLELRGGPRTGTFRFGRTAREATIVEGVVDDFPFYATNASADPGAAARNAAHAALTLWFDTDARLLAVRALPIDTEERPAGFPEWVLLGDYEMHDGVLLPTRLSIYQQRSVGRPQPLVHILPQSIDFDAALAPAQLGRNVRDG